MDGGATGVGVESTVLIVRVKITDDFASGWITKEQLEELIGHVSLDPALKDEKKNQNHLE